MVRRSMSGKNLWVTLAVIVFLSWGWWTSAPVLPADFWWHLAVGDDIVAHASIPRVDTYSWVYAGAPFFDQPWLAQVAYALLHRGGGLPLIVFANGAAIGLTGALLARTCVHTTDGDKGVAAALLVFVGIPAMTQNWLVRPQTLAYPLFVLMLAFVLERRMTSARWIAAFFTMAIWTNVHGSFVLGLVLVLIGLAYELGRALLQSPREWHRVAELGSLLAVSFAATTVNPRGIAVYTYVLDLTSDDTLRAVVSEWGRASLGTLSGRMLVILVGITLLGFVAHKRRPNGLHALLAVAFLVLAVTAGRHIVWFAIVALPLLATAYSRRSSTHHDSTGNRLVNASLVTVMLVALLLALPWTRLALREDAATALVSGIPAPSTIEALEQLAPRRLFNESSYGSYLMWLGEPVFFDPRFEFYPPEHVVEYFALSRGERLESSLKKWRFDAMLVSRELQPGLVGALESSNAWRLVTADADAMLFTLR